MSRVERHKARREGQITGVGKETAVEDKTKSGYEDKFDINPIVRQDETKIKRQKDYDNPFARKDISINDLKKSISDTKTELFDIEETFSRLAKEHRAPDYDTQLEIMAELFSNNPVEYNNVDFTRDETTDKIMISEDELMKLLAEREKAHQKLLNRKRRKEKIKELKPEPKAKKEKEVVEERKFEEVVELKEDTQPYLKEELDIEEIHYVKKDEGIKNRVDETLQSFDEFGESLDRKPWVLYGVIAVLVIVLAILVYTFLK